MFNKFGSIAAAIAFTGTLLVGNAVRAEAAQSWPIQVTSSYKLNFTGIGEVGKLQFQSRIEGTDYTSTGTAEVKIPLIYTWSSNLTGGGKLLGDQPKPIAYSFSSKGKPLIGGTKTNSIRMSFKDHAINQVNIVPPNNPGGPKYVPLLPEHLAEALDPLTAVMMFTRASGAAPCDRRMKIFDGKQRFDLILTPAGQQKVAEIRPSGQPGVGFVCKVRYVPIAGYKKK
jgi:Protein of unknown function (DUF3108)